MKQIIQLFLMGSGFFESSMQQVYGYIKDIVKEHATEQEIKAAIQKYMKHDKNI